jgi:biotin synthase
MCYAIPGKIVEVRGKIAIVDYFGERRRALNELQGVGVGDYVFAQGGLVVEKVPTARATFILSKWKEPFFRLKRLDSMISRGGDAGGSVGSGFEKIIAKARGGAPPKKSELLRLLKTRNEAELRLLFRAANAVRQRHLRNSCCVHGIIEFSNYCRNDCFYCGIRKGNTKLERYRMDAGEIVSVADFAVNKLGFKALVLQSGEDRGYSAKELAGIVEAVLEKCPVLLFVSIGTRSMGCYTKLYKAGARGVLLRFETSNPSLYRSIHSGPKRDFQRRIRLLRHAKKLGYIIATGSLIGLPNQSEGDLLSDILLTKSLGADMYSFGPLIPHPETPLGGAPLPDMNTALKVLAVSRIVSPKAKILVTTALETMGEGGRRMGLLSGANSLMVNVTPERYRVHYNLYPGRPDRDKGIAKGIRETLALLFSLGRAPTDLGV